ncbi:MAG TPA: hypothetical protein VLX28_02970 [Thermoanaerobaculia bacterium]|nr:hypothetical protein [Thermoanaerobaculia bacterium]
MGRMATGWRPGRRRRLLLGALLAAQLVAAGCGGGKVAVLHGVPEPEANRVLALLNGQGIQGGKTVDNPEAGTWSVSVPADAASQALALLADYKVSKVDDRRFRDIFGQNQLVVTPGEERALFVEALQGEIAHTLEGVPGVIQARVHLVLPEQDLAGRPQGDAKASVLLEYQPNPAGGKPLEEAEIQALVGHAISGLDPQAVAVLEKRAMAAAPAPANVPPPGARLVSVGSLLLEARALTWLKAAVLAVTLLVGLLGGMLLWQGRLVRRLEGQLRSVRPSATVITAVETVGKPAKAAGQLAARSEA